MKHFDEYEHEDIENEEIQEETLEDLIEYVLEFIDPNFEHKDFVLNRLSNLEGEYHRTGAAVTYFGRTDLDKTKWKFCYNLVIPVVIPNDEEESSMVKTLMLDIMRNSDIIEDNRPQLDGDNISTESIQIGGFEVFWLNMPHIRVSLG